MANGKDEHKGVVYYAKNVGMIKMKTESKNWKSVLTLEDFKSN